MITTTVSNTDLQKQEAILMLEQLSELKQEAISIVSQLSEHKIKKMDAGKVLVMALSMLTTIPESEWQELYKSSNKIKG